MRAHSFDGDWIGNALPQGDHSAKPYHISPINAVSPAWVLTTNLARYCYGCASDYRQKLIGKGPTALLVYVNFRLPRRSSLLQVERDAGRTEAQARAGLFTLIGEHHDGHAFAVAHR